MTPARRGSRIGNRVTALRWARLLRSLGHRVRVADEFKNGSADLLIALHARKSHGSVRRFRRAFPDRKVVVALTGTDLYQELGRSRAAQRSLELADRLVVLQPLGRLKVPAPQRRKVRAIFQSAHVPYPRRTGSGLEVIFVGHLRPVKDPFRIAQAVRRLPASSRAHVTHVGRALSPQMARKARAETRRNPRYRWIGERPKAQVLQRLCRAHVLVNTSRSEGGANVISEAVAAGVPVIASRIPGSIGLLGKDYPGYFPVGGTRALARLLVRFEQDPRFRAQLTTRCRALKPLVSPSRERQAWGRLLRELAPSRESR